MGGRIFKVFAAAQTRRTVLPDLAQLSAHGAGQPLGQQLKGGELADGDVAVWRLLGPGRVSRRGTVPLCGT